MVYQFVLGKQADIIKMMKKDGHFRPPMPFDEVRKKSHAIIGQGVKMGEGWLLPAEMVELISEGVTNIVCTQPFGEPHRGQGHDPKNPRGVPAGEYRRGGLRPGRVQDQSGKPNQTHAFERRVKQRGLQTQSSFLSTDGG